MKKCLLSLAAVLLAGCQVWQWDGVDGIGPTGDNYYRNGQGYYGNAGRYYRRQRVSVPNSYHMSRAGGPRSHKTRDAQWVLSQNPNGYTLEVSEGENAANVAGVLAKSPKLKRAAQVKYKNGSRTYYRGIYGSYNTREEAQAAMDHLPKDVRKKANIRPWSQVQAGISAPKPTPTLPSISAE